MAIDEEKLMAFADGELTGQEAEAVAAAIAADPALAEKLAQHRQLRAMLTGAFDPILDEPLPAGLTALTKPDARNDVIDFAAAKERSAARRQTLVQRWGSIAAALVVGIFAGHLISRDNGLLSEHNGALTARTELAVALDDQLASDDPAVRGSPIRIGLTFRNSENQYCRTFSAARADSFSGIACRQKGKWEMRMAAVASPEQGTNDYRLAGSNQAILDAAQAMMNGEPFDAAAEARARAKAWKDGRQAN